ncbi:MnhB domain-containing protein [Geofilum rhodophaeum]|uniref:MnhB domain-containing protein n=1 Tax=Geofilum rhodophaeum TaxID=1965019 RepID=UPI000B52504D|nr:MnhB domain-containing protein [Geofilum rhodophaeum]
MNNIILEKIALLFLRGMAIMSVFLLLRGHNSPGGGFIGAIVLAIGFIFYSMIFGSERIERILYFNTRIWMGIGLGLVLVAAVWPVFLGLDPLTGLWYTGNWPLLGEIHLGTPLIFDTGIFIGVAGLILSVIITIMEVLKWNT